MQKYKIIVILLIAIAFGGTFAAHKSRAPKRNYSDFSCFYKAGQRMLHKENIYVLRDKEAAEFRYAPVFAMLMSALALMDIDTADTIWFIFNFILLTVSFIVLRKIIFSCIDFRAMAIILGVTIMALIRFIMHNFDAGQSNILMMVCIIAGLYLIIRGRSLLGAFIFSLSIMIKYTPLVFLPYFIYRKQWKVALFIACSLLIYTFIPSLLVGFEVNLGYLKKLVPFLTQSTIFDFFTVLDPMNQSLMSFVHRMFTYCISYFHAPPMPFQSLHLSQQGINLIVAALGALMYLSIFLPLRISNNSVARRILIDYSLLMICCILFNLNSWKPNFIFLSMGYVVILDHLVKVKFKDRIALLLIALSFILNSLSSKAIFGEKLSYKICFYSPLTLSALVIFVCLLRIKFLKEPEGRVG